MNSTLKNKKVVAGVGVAAAAAAVLAVGAGTYAGFVDNAEGSDGTLATGTVFFDDTLTNPPVTVGKLAPGGDSRVQTMQFRNGGNQRGAFTIDFTLEQELEVDPEERPEACAGGTTGPEALADGSCNVDGDKGELDDQTIVVLTASGGDADTELFRGSVARLSTAPAFDYLAASGETVTFELDFTLPDLGGEFGNNAAQGDAFVLGSTLTLERPLGNG